MRNPRSIARPAAVTLSVILGLALSGCGSSSDGTSAASTTSDPAKATPAPVVIAKKDAKLGTVLADSTGLTLYTLTANGKPVDCTGPCLQAWPPLELPAGVKAPTGSAGITGLSAVQAAGGGNLVAAGGLPLYRFVKDKDAEDAYGEGIKSFGGVWHVSKTTAAPAPAAAEQGSTTEAPTTADSGY